MAKSAAFVKRLQKSYKFMLDLDETDENFAQTHPLYKIIYTFSFLSL